MRTTLLAALLANVSSQPPAPGRSAPALRDRPRLPARPARREGPAARWRRSASRWPASSGGAGTAADWTAKDASDRLLRREGRGGGVLSALLRRRADLPAGPGGAVPPAGLRRRRGWGTWCWAASASCTRASRSASSCRRACSPSSSTFAALVAGGAAVAAVPAAPALPGGAARPRGGGAGVDGGGRGALGDPRGGPAAGGGRGALRRLHRRKPMPEGQKNLAYALSYRAAERTLTRRGGQARRTGASWRRSTGAWAAQLRGR